MSSSLLNRADETRLIQAWQAGDLKARDRLILSLRPLITYQLARYRRPGLEPDDLMQAGYLGALYALRKFDPNRGFRLTTYAVNWIWATIAQAANRPNHLSLDQALPGSDLTKTNLTVADTLGVPDPRFDQYGPAHVVHAITREWGYYLDRREIEILTHHYLEGRTLAAIGRDLGISRERVRQLEIRALERLRPHLEPIAEELRA